MWKSLRTTLALALMPIVACAGQSSADDDAQSEDGLHQIAAPPIFVVPEHIAVARHPFVLVHAFNGSATDSWSFNGVKEALEADGQYVHAAEIAPYAGTPLRAAQLVADLDAARAGFCKARHAEQPLDDCLAVTKVNMVAHSQGGLDARYAISKLGYGSHTASLTTMGTPHRGTPIGDIGLRALQTGFADVIADTFFRLIGETRSRSDLAADTNVHDAFFWLSEQRAADPAYDMPDAPGVVYQSWAGVATISGATPADIAACEGKMLGTGAGNFALPTGLFFLPLVPAFRRPEQLPNDGHIPVASAKYGEFRGCIPANHLDLIGRPDDRHVGPSSRTGFDHRPLYRMMADELAKRGL